MTQKQREIKALENSRDLYIQKKDTLQMNLGEIGKKMSDFERKMTRKLIDEYRIILEMYDAKGYELGENRFGAINNPQQGVAKHKKAIKQLFEAYMQQYFPEASFDRAREIYNGIENEAMGTYREQLEILEQLKSPEGFYPPEK